MVFLCLKATHQRGNHSNYQNHFQNVDLFVLLAEIDTKRPIFQKLRACFGKALVSLIDTPTEINI